MFLKRKKMVDLADLPKRNVNLPHGKTFVPKDGCGFVDLTKKRMLPSEIRDAKKEATQQEPSQTDNSFSFFDTPVQSAQTNNSNSDDLIRKVSSQISDLDTKLYKLEQRIELLERKAGVGDSSGSSGFGW